MSATVDRSPARLSSAIGIGFAVVALVALGISATPLALGPAIVGAVAVGVGVRRGSRPAITLGTVGLLAGIVIGGALGTRPIAVLVATVAVALAWDASQNALTVGARLGRAAETRRVEVVHVAATTVVTSLAAGGGYVVARASIGSQSPVALLVLLLAAVVLTAALRGRTPG